MPKFSDSISDDHAEWVMKQAVFFTGSAPTHGRHINLSPKGLPSSSFAILGPNQCAYIDATGSGCETISHVRENGRVTIMFCSFAVSPRIMRFFCTGRVVEWDEEAERTALLKKMEVGGDIAGARAIIVLDVFKVQVSCGFGVPLLALEADPKDPSKQVPTFADRKTLGHWAGQKVEKNEIDQYRAFWNVRSLDGLPGLKMARRQNEKLLLWSDVKIGTKGRIMGLWHVAGATLLVAMLSSLATVLALSLLGFLKEDHKQSFLGKRNL